MATNLDNVLVNSHRAEPVGLLRRVIREAAPHDWIVLTYVVGLNIAALQAPPHPDRTAGLEQVFALLIFVVATLILVRGSLIRHDFWAPLLYRVAIYGSVQVSYFLFARFLPMVNPRSLDFELYQLDMVLFGFEPAVWMDRFINSFTTEWFAFFYFSYFFILALHVIPILFFVKDQRLLGEFALGMVILFCIGHVGYMLVPGYGPYAAIPDAFAYDFPSGLWLDMVMATVAQGGAQKDIFPSLHTAAPTLIALYAFRQRFQLPFRYTWWIVAFFAINIIIATMFLRWHWIIDVVAGLVLAVLASQLAVVLTGRELERRRILGLTPNWPTFFGRKAPDRATPIDTQWSRAI